MIHYLFTSVDPPYKASFEYQTRHQNQKVAQILAISIFLFSISLSLTDLLIDYETVLRQYASYQAVNIYFVTSSGVFSLLFLALAQTQNALFRRAKHVLVWLFSVGLISVFKINDANSTAFFKGIFFSAIKWTIILEFFANLYSFSLLTEIIIMPILTFLGITKIVADREEKDKTVSKYLQNIIAIAGLLIFSYSLYKTVTNFNNVLTLQTLVAFLLPSMVTILFIPFLYFLALYCTYESYFVHLDFMTVKKDKVKEVKRLILRIANVNLDKLLRIKRNFTKRVFYDNTDLKDYMHKISSKSYIKV